MFACPNCWETQCVCGYKYKDLTVEQLEKQIKILQRLLISKKNSVNDNSLMSHGE